MIRSSLGGMLERSVSILPRIDFQKRYELNFDCHYFMLTQ